MSRLAYPLILLLLGLAYVSNLGAATDSPEFRQAVAALQKGDWPGARQHLEAELKQFPAEAEALSLLGVVLDNLKDFTQAEQNHKLAMANAPGSPGILNNYGNHLLLAGNPKDARDVFLKAVSLDPADDYANMQLAQLAVKAKDGKEALLFLDRLPANQRDAPNVAVFRLAALDLTGDRAEAATLFDRLSSATENDAAASASLGRTLAQAGQFAQAEVFLTHALAPNPTDFGLLYQLGAVASGAGHNDRAREVLEKALREQPRSVDTLYALAFVYHSLNQPESAVRLLAQAAKLAPQRADVQRLLAVTAADMRAFDDSVAAWERYVALAPDDDQGRRELGFARAHIKQPTGLADLEWYVARHPEDATGLWELGVAQAVDDPEKGIATLDKAIALDPGLVDARSARGTLNYQQGKAEAALADLQFAASKQPENAQVLDRLGETWLLLDRTDDALRALRAAAGLAPDDARIQLHLANALGAAGQTAESRIYMQRYKELGGGTNVVARGLMDYLSLSPEQQHADYRARVEKAVREKPGDVATQVLYLKLSVADNKMDDAAAAAQKISALKPGAPVLADAGHALLEAKQYRLAAQLLAQADAAGPAANVNLELGIAEFHTEGLAAGLQRLDRVPESERGGDYYLARAEMLDASGKSGEAIAAMQQGVRAEPSRPDLYWRTAALMMKNRRAADAIQLLEQASKSLPDEPRIPVIRASLLALTGKTEDARRLLSDARRRWPETAAVWVAEGIVEESSDPAAASKSLETAVALGAHSPETYYALAETSLRAGPDRLAAAKTAIGQALKLAPDDAGFRELAARIESAPSAPRPAAGPGAAALDPARLFLARAPKDW